MPCVVRENSPGQQYVYLSIIKKPTEKANDLQPRARLAVWTTKEEFFDVLTTKQQDV